MPKNDFTKITGLWPSKPGSATKYLSGQLNDQAIQALAQAAKSGGRVFIFQETERKSEKHPTHSLVIAPPPQAPRQAPAPKPDPADESDFPF